MDENDYYYEAWICELSHIVVGSTKDDLVWNRTKEINGELLIVEQNIYMFLKNL